MRLTMMTAAVVLAAFGSAQADPFDGAGTPSFKCAKAATATEKAICERWMGTAVADRMLADLVKEAASAPGADAAAIKADQKAFLKTRDACAADATCITDAYLARIGELSPAGRLHGRFTFDGSEESERNALVLIEGKGGRTGVWLVTNTDDGKFSCGFDTIEAKRQGSAIVIDTPASDGAEACSATFTIDADGQGVELSSECRNACGMNGWMDGGYSRVK